MTEEVFWQSNPRIIKVYEKIYKEKENRRNQLVHAWIGDYGVSALTVAIDHVLNGKKAKSKYKEKPMRLFELTPEEKEKERQNAINMFLMWAGMTENKYKGKEG